MKNEKEKRATFTPGPWAFRECPKNGHYEGGEDPFTISMDEKFVASVKLQSRSTQANARLIAAAPELHAQAKILERLLVELSMQGETGTDEALDEVREVLAKVDGGEG